MISTPKPRVILVGGLPQPSGGVTVFLGRLVNTLGDLIDFHLLDINPGEKLPNKAITHRILAAKTSLRFLGIAWFVRWISADIVHFHYSRPISILSFYIIPLIRKKIHLTLHNGDLHRGFSKRSWLVRTLIKIAAKRIDKVYAISPQQVSFFKEIGLAETKIIKIKTHMPPAPTIPAWVDQIHKEFAEKFKQVVVASGHVDRDYNYEFLIRFLNEHQNVGGIMFVYGRNIDEAYLRELNTSLRRPEQLLVYRHRSEEVFLGALQLSAAYLRPNFVDSWGVAVADATILRIPAVASDVCERYPGSTLFKTGSYEDFEEKTAGILKNPTSFQSPSETLNFKKTLLKAYQI